jgi:hypothetical protein
MGSRPLSFFTSVRIELGQRSAGGSILIVVGQRNEASAIRIRPLARTNDTNLPQRRAARSCRHGSRVAHLTNP